MSNANDLLTKSSYCRNSKHAKCHTAGCECKCHAPKDAEDLAVAAKAKEAYEATNGTAKDELAARRGPKMVGNEPSPEDAPTVEEVLADIPQEQSPAEVAEIAAVQPDAAQLIADRLDPSKAPAPAPKAKAKAKGKAKAKASEKPVVKGTVDGKLSNAHKRAIRLQMVTYLAAMPVDLTGDLEGVTPEEAAAYVDTYWVKYIDPARDKARHAK